MSGVWGDSWTTGAWGVSWGGDVPPTPGVTGRSDGGYSRKKYPIIERRPVELEPEIARARVVKKVAKRLKIKRINAADLVLWAEQALGAGFEFRPVQNLANSAQKDLEKAQIAQIRAYWAALEQAAIEIAAEDEEILLWLS